MAAFQQTFRNIGTQLGGLPVTAKLLVAALMVILVMSLLLVALFTGRPGLVPLAANLPPEAQARAVSYLQTNGIPHDVVAGEVRVPPDRKYAVLAQLTEGQYIQADQIEFDELIAEDSPFLTRAQHDKRWLVAKMNVLSSLISSFSGIERATVVIDQPQRQSFGIAFIPPKASVQVVPRGDLTPTQVEAIADLVAGSHAGLDVTNVSVVDAKTGKSHTPRSPEEIASTRNLEVKRKIEKDTKAKLEAFLGYIANVRVAVNALVDSRALEERTDAYEDPKIGPVREQSESRRLVEQSGAMEPGVRPNAGVEIAQGVRAANTSTEEKTDNRLAPKFPVQSRWWHDDKGYPLKINATIGVPRSYFVNKFRLDQGDPAANPDDRALQPTVEAETAVIKNAVIPLIDTVAHDGTILGTVVVNVIPELIAITGMAGEGGQAGLAPGGAAGAASGVGGGLVSGGLLKQLGLGGLALLALALMLMMVRKAGRVELPNPQEVAGVPPLLPSEDDTIVGEAEESELALEALELDDGQLRRQQMLNQISTMVKEDPDEVANLLRRWITIEA